MARRTVKTLIGNYPHTAPLKTGAVRSDTLDFDFTEIEPVWDGFKGMIREYKYDLSEMAIVTYLLARAHGKPLTLLPATMSARIQHGYALYDQTRGRMTPADLNGKTVGIRSFTTTTGAWLRGILANDYGVDLGSIEWVTFEDPHVAEYRDTTRRGPPGKKIAQMLLEGDLDAILGEPVTDPRMANIFGDAQAEGKRWSQMHRLTPINHMVVMKTDTVKAEPEMVQEVWRLLKEAKRLAGPAADPDPLPFGIEANRPALDLIAEYAYQQELIPRRISVDEMFAETRALLEG